MQRHLRVMSVHEISQRILNGSGKENVFLVIEMSGWTFDNFIIVDH